MDTEVSKLLLTTQPRLGVPSIRKKLVYLDQSFLSNCLPEKQTEIEKRLLYKLRELKLRQKIFVVVSDIHCSETSAYPDKYREDREKLWQLQNTLANGNIAGNFFDVFAAQTRRMLAVHDKTDTFPFTDIGLEDPHRWQVGMNVVLTNSWRIRLHRASASPRDQINEKLCNIIDQQVENIQNCREVRDCLNHVLELWRKDIQQGIDAYQQRDNLELLMERNLEAFESGLINSFQILQLPDAPFRQIVGEVIDGLNKSHALQRWTELLKSEPTSICPSLQIRTAIEAELLWSRWKKLKLNPKKFNENYGLSRQNDVDHISAFAPYVDALTTDNDMRKLCEHEGVAKQLSRFPVKIFSKNNYDELEIWLDNLLAISGPYGT